MLRILLPFLVFSLVLSQSKGPDKASQVGYESITANDLKAHLTFLSSSELEGRETSYRGQKVAAQYIASVFRKLGLKPAGNDGSFFQSFTVVVTKPSPKTSFSLTSGTAKREFVFGKDFLTTSARETTVTAPVVLIGFQDASLSKEQQESLSDKIVVMFSGNRDAASDTARGRRPRRGFRFPQAAGTIIITDEASAGTIESQARAFANMLEKGQMVLKDAPARAFRASAPVAMVGPEVASVLLKQFKGSPEEVRGNIAVDSTFAPTALKGISATIDIKADVEEKTSENVAGLLEGSDPVLKNEYLLFTAHYDHVGISAVDGAIYHGADDDGSGTSTILELAEAFVLNPVKPKRSILFMTVAGEEKGLLGSSYYSEHPLYPLERTIADINMDMVGRTDKKHMDANDKRYVYVIGSDKISTELDSLVASANTQSVRLSLDYQYNDDNDPNQFYRRSDHYNFARKGVPIVFFFTGVHEDYHRPTDTIEKIVFGNMVDIGRLAFVTGWKTANFRRMLHKHGKPSAYGTE